MFLSYYPYGQPTALVPPSPASHPSPAAQTILSAPSHLARSFTPQDLFVPVTAAVTTGHLPQHPQSLPANLSAVTPIVICRKGTYCEQKAVVLFFPSFRKLYKVSDMSK
ncbi:polypyrimidine tract-binding protein 1 isoform X6 [Biomphalaria glabrata]|nr:polypyrimidine tract-binding protein 1 isoform X6 [Biomphalaria glabrata]